MSPAVRKEFLIQCAEDRQEVGGFWGNLSSHGRAACEVLLPLLPGDEQICSSNQTRMSRQMNPQYTYRSPCGVLPHHPNVEVYHVHAKRKSNSPLLFSTGQDRILGTYAMGGSAPEATRWFLDSPNPEIQVTEAEELSWVQGLQYRGNFPIFKRMTLRLQRRLGG